MGSTVQYRAFVSGQWHVVLIRPLGDCVNLPLYYDQTSCDVSDSFEVRLLGVALDEAKNQPAQSTTLGHTQLSL
jgi:hypothetical protein